MDKDYYLSILKCPKVILGASLEIPTWLSPETHRTNFYKIPRRYKIKVIAYPTQIPELSPTENLWVWSKKNIRERSHFNLEELWDIANAEWGKIVFSEWSDLVWNDKKKTMEGNNQ